MKHYRVVWFLKDGEEIIGATMHPTTQDAEKEATKAFNRRENWSQRYEVREFPPRAVQEMNPT